MGVDFYLNPPKDPCSKCGKYVEDRYTRKLLCLSCYHRALKAEIKRLKSINKKLQHLQSVLDKTLLEGESLTLRRVLAPADIAEASIKQIRELKKLRCDFDCSFCREE